ncbi:hypothetical protein SAMN02787144_10515 [Streptomyces atratus]|uniref:ABC transporter permease n=1 Tax=Streptomyces atratus TaxID=1893 RepID=A0A1K2FAD4_STRAR|nr:hypothetical protein SAMN02787144_10515 [Streptomyces atratus]
MIRAYELTKKYGDNTVVQDLDFTVRPGTVTGFHDTDQAASLGDPGVFGAIVGNSAGITLLSLIALGLGALLRSVPGAIGAYIGGVLILPEVLSMLPYDVVESAIKYFPTQAAGVLGSATPLEGDASTGGALLALLLWAATSLGAAAMLLRRRDA